MVMIPVAVTATAPRASSARSRSSYLPAAMPDVSHMPSTAPSFILISCLFQYSSPSARQSRQAFTGSPLTFALTATLSPASTAPLSPCGVLNARSAGASSM